MSPDFLLPLVPPEVEHLLRQAHDLGPLIRDVQQVVEVQRDAVELVRSLSPFLPVVQDALRQMAEWNSPSGILARQAVAMAAIEASFLSRAAPTPAEMEEARASLQRNLPETAEQAGEVEQRAATIAADPEGRKLVERITTALKQADLSKVPRAVVPVVVYWLLCRDLGLPFDGEVTPAQHADFFGVLAIVVVIWVYLFPLS
jgi:hypothetical protein